MTEGAYIVRVSDPDAGVFHNGIITTLTVSNGSVYVNIPTNSDHNPYAWIDGNCSPTNEVTDAEALDFAYQIISSLYYSSEYDVYTGTTIVSQPPIAILGVFLPD